MLVQNNQFTDLILNRRSIRKYKAFQLESKTLESIFEMALRAPSANNLQPWTFRVIQSAEAKAKYSHLFNWNRSQYETSSAMILVFVDTRFASRAEAIYDKAVSMGKMTPEVRERQLNNFKSQNPNPLDIIKIAYLDAGLIAMNLMLAARYYGLDTCPIGGFDKQNAPQAFGLENHEAVMALSIGLADDTGFESVRLGFDQVVKVE
ncbi:nitroreductase family protein [Acholeplasma vituli]|uniref:Nitroreductase family protein n=1 Tax=Paracholeplasma vituli TaxID=69473 RepID=A0ABT2PWH9_9MOLU|nr:nitroreductase family protein [Paracholeplasma vituli]MCU0104674.1 nitroreductase family protein [Paracholeplasma vituli]